LNTTHRDAVSYAGLLIKLTEATNSVYPILENDKDVDGALTQLCEVIRLAIHTQAFLIQNGRK
jgi:hypothetical protein